MSSRRARFLASVVVGVTILFEALYAYYAVALAPGHVPPSFAPHEGDWVGLVTLVTFAIVGAVIVWRQSSNAIGWLLCAVPVSAIQLSAANAYAGEGLYVAPGSLPGPTWVLWAEQWTSGVPFALMLVFLPLLFPNGRLVSPRWRVVAWLALAAEVVNGASLVDPELLAQYHLRNPAAVPALKGPSELLGAVAGIVFLLCALAAMVSLVVRYRREGSDERHQLKWMLGSVVLVTILFGLTWPLEAAHVLSLPNFIAPLTLCSIPIAIGIAILKYRLYDIDIVINRALVYGALAAFITGIYVAIVVGIGSLIGQGGKPNLALSILATAIVAVAFQPVRERVQRVANRLVYGKRATPYEVLSEFSGRMSDAVAGDELLPRMARILAEGTGATRADVWLRRGAELRPAASWPDDGGDLHPVLLERSGAANGAASSGEATAPTVPPIPGADRSVAVIHQGELLGALTVSKRPGEGLTPIEEKLLADLAAQAGLVLRNVGLTAELLARLEELRASRQRLVAAQDAERRRLERNLHDGAQQNLVALKVKLGLAEVFAQRDPQRAKQLLSELKADADEALETLRDLARGIYPPLLADRGLVAALEAQARKASVPVSISADGIGRHPQEVEGAVYFCCLEALQNVAKYAGAENVTVRLVEQNGRLSFSITDDGRGFDPATTPRGSGLQNMADRLDALGGELAIRASRGEGTTVDGCLPVRVAEPVA